MNGEVKKRQVIRVQPGDICERYLPRAEAMECLKGCWYCRYADFHLKEVQALEIGFCYYPKIVI